jgi:hypothetical protein
MEKHMIASLVGIFMSIYISGVSLWEKETKNTFVSNIKYLIPLVSAYFKGFCCLSTCWFK